MSSVGRRERKVKVCELFYWDRMYWLPVEEREAVVESGELVGGVRVRSRYWEWGDGEVSEVVLHRLPTGGEGSLGGDTHAFSRVA